MELVKSLGADKVIDYMKEDYRYVETGRKKGTVVIVITPHESHYRDANPIIQQPALMIYGDQDMIPKQGGRH